MKLNWQCAEQERWGHMTDKIILFLVEGPTDEDSLALVYSKIVKKHDIQFEVLHTDITADENTTVKYIEESIEKAVDKYLKKNQFINRRDILKVIQIIDTDGAFVPNTMVKQSDTGRTEYFEQYILAKNKDRLIRRNISKRSIVHKLVHSDKVAGFPYEIYYFSRNMEHVLHNISEDLTDEEKEDLAFEVADRYSEHAEDFLKLLYNGSFHVSGTYEDTWSFIMENGNSLKRYSNMSVFFEKLGIVVNEE